jgi:predicted RNase H-like HicB family nuclease
MTKVNTTLDNASMHDKTHCPISYPIEYFSNHTYNCILYEIEGEGFSAFSADALGVNGEGNTYDKALHKLKSAIECQIKDGLGGIYLGTSDIAFQNTNFKSLEDSWESDGVVVVRKVNSTITIFSKDNEDNYCVVCGISMGIHNPRQLCCKYYCENESSI